MPVYKSKEKVKYSKKNSYNIPHNNQLTVQNLMPASLQETATPLLTHEFKQGDILYGLYQSNLKVRVLKSENYQSVELSVLSFFLAT